MQIIKSITLQYIDFSVAFKSEQISFAFNSCVVLSVMFLTGTFTKHWKVVATSLKIKLNYL